MSAREWRSRALCAARPDLDWYADLNTTDGARMAVQTRAVCAGCPVLRECFAAVQAQERGLSIKSRHGITAGLAPAERWAIANRRTPKLKPELALRLFGPRPAPAWREVA